MAKYGITRVPIDYFHYKGYRYTNLDDAIAQAKREHAADRSDRRERSSALNAPTAALDMMGVEAKESRRLWRTSKL